MAAKPDITVEDLLALMKTSKDWQEEDPEKWMAKAGLTHKLIWLIGTTIVDSIRERISDGEATGDAIYQEALTAFQLGWLVHKEFGDN